MIGDVPLHRGRLKLMAFLLLAGWAGLVYRLTDIQLLRSGYFSEKAERQYHREVVLQPSRGRIVDRYGRLLAADRLLHTVGVYPRLVEDSDVVAAMLTDLLGEDREYWKAEISAHDRFFYAARQVDLASQPPPSHLLPQGLEVVEEYRRVYPRRQLAANVIGHTGIDGKGLEGLELQYEEVLRGQPGLLVQQIDATGAPIPGMEVLRDEPVDGMTLRLTLDAVIQEVLEEELAFGVAESDARGGLAVALDPRTGAVLAMASWPTYDPNYAEAAEEGSRRNRTITDSFEPGSVLKLVTFTAALEAGGYTLADTIDGGNGVIQVVGSEIKDTRPHGRMSLGEVLQYSSNVGTVKIARHVGPNRMYRYARDLGFGQVSGLDLPGEASGLLRRLPEWRGPALESLSIGYGLSVTALQIASAYAAVCNGGSLLTPFIVESMQDERGRWHDWGGRELVRRVMHKETAELLRGFLKDAVTGGTGDRASVAGLDIAGKTGTARKAVNGSYEAGSYISSFCGFIPADDPQFILLVVVDEPANRYYASEVAAPIFSRTVRRLISHPEYPLKGLQPSVYQVVDRPAPIVPDLRRWPASEAGKALSVRGLRVRFVGKGPTVLSQEPQPLEQAREGQVVVLNLDTPFAPNPGSSTLMPDLRGLTLREAAAQVSSLGLILSVEGSGLISRQTPRPGSEVRSGSTVQVHASVIGEGR